MVLSDGSFMIFIESPISAVLLALALFSGICIAMTRRRQPRLAAAAGSVE